MATAGSPLRDDEIIGYMLTGLGSAFNPIAASLNMITRVVTAAEFYSMPRAPLPAFSGGGSQPGYGGGNSGRQTYGGNGGGGYGSPAGGHAQPYGPPAGGNGNGRPTGGNYGGNGGGGNRGQNGGRRRQRPQCQICGYWGHSADDCRNRFNPDFVRGSNQQRTGNNQ
nr:glycine-rich cell wall structural protein-like [Lolium perenne]